MKEISPLRALGGFDVFPARPFYLNPSSHNSASLPGAATPILSTKCPLRTAGQLQLTAGGAPRQPGGRNPRVRWPLPASESLTRKGPAPPHLPACSVYKFRACLLCTLTSAGKGSPAFLYQRKHSCLMQRASKLTETNLRCRFLVFRISAKPTPLWPSKQQLGSFQGRVCA